MRALLALTVLAMNAAIAAPDPHSYANFDAVRVTHVQLDLDVSFERRQLSGFAELSLQRLAPDAGELVLDTRDLSIDGVLAINGEQQYRAARYTLAPRDPIFGQALRIALPPTVGFLVQVIKGTALASVIGFIELTKAGTMITNATFRPFTVYACVALMYFLLCWPISAWSRRLERSFKRER